MMAMYKCMYMSAQSGLQIAMLKNSSWDMPPDYLSCIHSKFFLDTGMARDSANGQTLDAWHTITLCSILLCSLFEFESASPGHAGTAHTRKQNNPKKSSAHILIGGGSVHISHWVWQVLTRDSLLFGWVGGCVGPSCVKLEAESTKRNRHTPPVPQTLVFERTLEFENTSLNHGGTAPKHANKKAQKIFSTYPDGILMCFS